MLLQIKLKPCEGRITSNVLHLNPCTEPPKGHVGIYFYPLSQHYIPLHYFCVLSDPSALNLHH